LKPDRCRLCGATLQDPPIVGEFVFGGRSEQHFYSCSECEVAFQFPALREDEEARFYAKEFEKFMEKRAGDAAGWVGPERHIEANRETFARRFPHFRDLVKPGCRVLEIGCSSGFMLFPLRELGAEVVGIDPSELFTDYLNAQGIRAYHSLDEVEASEPAPFDLILHFFVLEHVRDPISFLKRGMGLLRQGGTMFFEVPSREDALVSLYDIPAFHRFYWSVAHHWYFNRPSIEYVLRQVDAPYSLIPVQRYDLSNHLVWAAQGRPGGQGRYDSVLGGLNDAYRAALCDHGYCDAYFGLVRRSEP
jgi:SAM-dependent methyltransferase